MTKTQLTLDDLAAMVGRGFSEQRKYMDGRFEQIDKRFEQVDKHFEKNDAQFLSINSRLDLIEIDLSNLNNLYQEVREIHQLLDEVSF